MQSAKNDERAQWLCYSAYMSTYNETEAQNETSKLSELVETSHTLRVQIETKFSNLGAFDGLCLILRLAL